MVGRYLTIARRFIVIPLALILCIMISTLLGVRLLVQDIHQAAGKITSQRGIDQKSYIRLNGAHQWITIRGQDRNKPILFYLHGGPGGTTSGLAYEFQRPWEEYFTVVQWDQRGFGRSAVDAEKLKGTITHEQIVKDAIALIEHLRRKLHQPKIILLGHSWGSIIGAEVARRRPDLLYAYVGFGQVTGWERNFVETRNALLRIAERSHNRALSNELKAIGDPPPATDADTFMKWVSKVQRPVTPLGGSLHNARNSGALAGRMLLTALTSPDLTLGDIYRMLSADRNAALLPLARSAAGWDFRRTLGTKFAVPMILVSGRYDLQAPTAAAATLSSEICSPYTEMVQIEGAAHFLVIEQPGTVLQTLLEHALPFAEGRAPLTGRQCSDALMN